MGGRLRRRIIDGLPEQTLRRIQRVRHREHPSLRRPAVRVATRGADAAVVETFDAHAARADVAAAITRGLDSADVPYVLLPGPHGSFHQVAVSAADRAEALAALDRALTGPGWVVRPGASARETADVVKIHRVLAAPGGQILCGTDTTCELAFWRRLGSDDVVSRTEGGTHRRGTYLAPGKNTVAAYLTETSWQRAVAAPSHWVVDEPPPGIFEVREPIDIVYTWVDGGDPAWQARKEAFVPDPQTAAALNPSATALARFLNRDELRYSLRSVAMYASWVRRIYLVTDGQVPEWLDTTQAKVVVVDHRDVFADPQALPVFNSHAIESQLHHIDGLAEHYLYLNDDMFLGRPVFPELFFHANGIAKFFLAPGTTLDLDAPGVSDLPAISAAKNQRALLERDFGVTVRQKMQHGPHPQLRSVLAEMEQRYPRMFDDVSRSRFRHPDDHSIPSSLQHYYAYARGRAVPGEWHFRYQDIGQENTPRRLDQILRERPQAFCLNDMASSAGDAAAQQEILAQFFGAYFPLPAPWER